MARKASFLLKSPGVIRGVGVARSASLAKARIETIAEMFRAGPRRVHSFCPDVPAEKVGQWFCAAMLLRAGAVAADMAAALVEGGIRTTKKLAEASLDELERAVSVAHREGQLRKPPSRIKLASLQKAARRLEGTGMLAGRVLDASRKPLVGISVELGNQETKTDEAGRFAFDQVSSGRVRIRINLGDRDQPMRFRTYQVLSSKLTGPITFHIPDPPAGYFPSRISHELDGKLVVNMAGTVSKLTTLPLSEFRDGTHFQVRQMRKGATARLLSLYKVRVGQTVHVQVTKVPTSQLPADVRTGDVLLLSSGTLLKTGLSPQDVALMKGRRWEETAARASRILSDSQTTPPKN